MVYTYIFTLDLFIFLDSFDIVFNDHETFVSVFGVCVIIAYFLRGVL